MFDGEDAADDQPRPGDGRFRPPPGFVQASLARQTKIKQLQEERAAAQQLPDADRASPPQSPRPQQRQPRRPQGSRGGSGPSSPKAGRVGGSGPSAKPSAKAAGQRSGIVNTAPSKAVLEVERMRQQRIERRQRQSEIKKAKEGLDEDEQKTLAYRQIIDRFRAEFKSQREALGRRLAAGGDQPARRRTPKIQVCIRKRPIDAREMSNKNFDIVTTATERFPYAHVYIHEPKVSVDMTRGVNTHKFMFDNVFDDTSTNEQVHAETTAGLVRNLFRGGRVTLFAYGQTGSGKTHTIFGTKSTPGIYEYACRDIFEHLASPAIARKQLALHVAFFEIYGGRVFDLFSDRRRIQLLEDSRGSVQLVGHAEYRVETMAEMLSLVKLGSELRTTGTTEANSQSSRSHAIIRMELRAPDGSLYAKFSLVDLAGSERGADTGNISRQARMEGSEINKSLLALKECIRALHRQTTLSLAPGQHAGGASDAHAGHIPFRASKLTQILRDSFIGRRSQTVMIAMISPVSASAEHSLNTLRYADRVKEFRRARPADSRAAAQDTSSAALPSPTESEVDSPQFDDDVDLGEHDVGVEEDDDDDDDEDHQDDDFDAVADHTAQHADDPATGVPYDQSAFDDEIESQVADNEIENANESELGYVDNDIEDETDGSGGNETGAYPNAHHEIESVATQRNNHGTSTRDWAADRAGAGSDSSSGANVLHLRVRSAFSDFDATADSHAVAPPLPVNLAPPQQRTAALSAASSRTLREPSRASQQQRPVHLYSHHQQQQSAQPVQFDREPEQGLYGAASFASSSDSLISQEEDLVNKHLACIAANSFLSKRERMLLVTVSRDDRNMAKYASDLRALVDRRIELWSDLRNTICDVEARLARPRHGNNEPGGVPP
ncbi:hypothetical protein HK105_204697 [Polyrhizophydium stewartii]|uniref:Kinesin-like protein n=1 Tax=Polyrhizophydium stewartii TaxID=2732419 RepID=A0ABR4N8E9_9FUNG